MRRIAWILGLIAALPAWADEVVLHNGARFEGRIIQTADRVTVVMDFGSVTFNRRDVAQIIQAPSALTEYETKLAALKPDDVEGRYQLAVWARQNGLATRATKLFEDVMARDPNHEGAREALGYRKYEGRWLTDDEIMAAKGYVKYGGAWVTAAEAEELRRREERLAAEELRWRELELASLRIQEAELAAQRAREEAEELRRLQYECPYYWGPYDYYPTIVVVTRPVHKFRRHSPCPPVPCPSPTFTPAPTFMRNPFLIRPVRTSAFRAEPEVRN